MKVRRDKISLFIVLSFLYSWFVLLIFLQMDGEWNTPAALPVGVLYMFGPTAAALTVQRVFGDQIAAPLGLKLSPNRWFLVAWLLPIALAFTALGTGLLLPGIDFSADMRGFIQYMEQLLPADQRDLVAEQMLQLPLHPAFWMLLQAMLFGPTINALAALGEELGWRGFMQNELRFTGFWQSSLIVGLVWGVWHTPIILQGHNYPDNPIAGVFMMILLTVLFSPIFTYVTARSGSVLAAAILHGTFNASIGLSRIFVSGGTDLTAGSTGLAGIFALLIANVCLLLYDRHLAADPLI